MKSAIFFIVSPFEMLSAVCAKRQYQLEDYIMYILCGEDGRENQLINIAEYYELNYKKVDHISITGGRLKNHIKDCFLNKNKKYDYVFSGDFRNPDLDMAVLKYCKIGGKLIKLDDGNSSISFFDGSYVFNKSQERLNRIVRCVSKIRFIRVCYFTAFALTSNKKKNIQITNMEGLGDKEKNDVFTKCDVLFIGTNFESYCADKDISKEYLLQIIRSVFATHIRKDDKVLYIPHGRDITQGAIIEQLDSNNIRIEHPKDCIELFLLKNRIKPYSIFGFTSTALFSLIKIFPEAKVYNVCPKKTIESNKVHDKVNDTCKMKQEVHTGFPVNEYEIIRDFYKINKIETLIV